jgi:hypothetical protein
MSAKITEVRRNALGSYLAARRHARMMSKMLSPAIPPPAQIELPPDVFEEQSYESQYLRLRFVRPFGDLGVVDILYIAGSRILKETSLPLGPSAELDFLTEVTELRAQYPSECIRVVFSISFHPGAYGTYAATTPPAELRIAGPTTTGRKRRSRMAS